ncbi:MAG: hypothetical protein LBL66_06960 [Clostridiales bacterium]|nr:hypothetical protein [Clostridiales bacterium]
MRGGRVKRPTWQSLYKKARFVFCRDCRVALRAPRNDRYQRSLYTPVCRIKETIGKGFPVSQQV